MEEREEDTIKQNNNASKRMKSKIAKNNKKQVKPSEKQKYKIKVSETLENEGVDYEEELSKNNKLQIELWKDNELFCTE